MPVGSALEAAFDASLHDPTVKWPATSMLDVADSRYVLFDGLIRFCV